MKGPANDELFEDAERSWVRSFLHPVVGGVVGGLVGATFAAVVTDWIKQILAVVSGQDDWLLIVAPLAGIAASVVALHKIGKGAAVQSLSGTDEPPGTRLSSWRSFPLDLARADLTADVVASAGREERFPWRLAPIRTIAIVATVGLGAPMGTESPAAHLGAAAGAAIGSRRWARHLSRWACLGGGAAAVAALMGLPLVGLAFILELGRRRQAPVSLERLLAASTGAFVGWAINSALRLDFIRLAVPRLPPGNVGHAMLVAATVGAASGAIASATGVAIYAARAWKSPPLHRLLIAGTALALITVSLLVIAGPSAAIGPGGGSVVWADGAGASGWTLMSVALLRAAATTLAVAAGGCGGMFVPFLAIGDVAGRALVPLIGGPPDLAGAAGAAGGIAGGYRLPLTAFAMVVGVGGPSSSTATCLATVAVAAISGRLVASIVEALRSRLSISKASSSRNVDSPCT